MAAKIYIYRNGVEVTDHPLHGKYLSGTGAYIGTVNGFGVRDQLYPSRTSREPGTETNAAAVQEAPVMVKIWYGPDASEWCVFATADQVRAAGKKLEAYRPNALGMPPRS